MLVMAAIDCESQLFSVQQQLPSWISYQVTFALLRYYELWE